MGDTLGIFEAFQTIRILWNLAKFYPELTDTAAALVRVPGDVVSFAAPGPWDFEVRDEAHYRVTFPVGGRDRPAIVFSGGGGDDGTAYSLLARHWASHGFCVFQPVHFDSYNHHLAETGSKFWASQRTTWDVWGLALCEKLMWKSRCSDVSNLLDEIGDFGGLVDPQRIGAGGYSYGAHVACLLGGAIFRGRGGYLAWRERRVRAVLNISNECGALGQPKGVWKGLTTPTLTITGEYDKTVWGRNFRAKTEAYRYSPAGQKEIIIIPGANHYAFSGRLVEAAVHPADVKAQRAIFGWVLGATTKFWTEQLGGG